jgi:hypothetical protein
MAQPSNDDMIHLDTICKMGFPTFDEFRKNPDKWRKGIDEIFVSMEKSTQIPGRRNRLTKQRYMWRDQFKIESLEKLQRVAKEEGYTANDLEMCPVQMNVDGTDPRGRIEIVIQVWPKWEWQAKGKVLTNND